MSYPSQCVKVPLGASGSSAMIAKLLVPAGGSVTVIGGVASSPSQVNCFGTGWPSVNAGLTTVNAMDGLLGYGSLLIGHRQLFARPSRWSLRSIAGDAFALLCRSWLWLL